MAKIEFKDVKGGVDVFVDGRHIGRFNDRKAAFNYLYSKELHTEIKSDIDWTIQTR